MNKRSITGRLLSSNGDKESYILGLAVVSCIILMIFFVWGGILVILKLRGKDAGCAAGNAFKTNSSSIEKNSSEAQGSGAGLTDADDDFELSLGSNLELDEEYDDEPDSENTSSRQSPSHYSDTEDMNKKKIRERRTRIAMFLVGTMLLLCVPMMLIFVLSPLQKSVTNSGTVAREVEEIISDLNASVQDIAISTISVERTVNGTPAELSSICPNVNDPYNVSGINVKQVVQDFLNEFREVDAVVWQNISSIQDIVIGSKEALQSFRGILQAFKRYFWVIPITLLFASVLTTIAMVTTQRAWRKRSGPRLQMFMAYLFTPLFVLYTVTCWMVTIAACLATMLGVDICTAGPSPGSPDVTFQNAFLVEGSSQDLQYQFVKYYTNVRISQCLVVDITLRTLTSSALMLRLWQGCIGNDPTAILSRLQGTIQNYIDDVWRHISDVDSKGDTYLAQVCGGGNEFLAFLDGVQNVAKLLAQLRTAVESTTISLRCTRINPIYENAAYDVLCGEAANASSWGFLLFFIISISSTVIISLRASWYHEIEEERVYQDENDIAENMVLDEHEEYLEYISKYKHEWQEYRGGFRTESMDDWDEDQSREDGEESADLSYLSGSTGSAGSSTNDTRKSGEVDFDNAAQSNQVDEVNERQRAIDFLGATDVAEARNEDSVDTQDISFPSLTNPQNEHSRASAEGGRVGLEPTPSLLQPSLAGKGGSRNGANAKHVGRDPDGAKRDIYPLLFREDEVDDESDSDANLNALSSPPLQCSANGSTLHQCKSTADSDHDMTEGEGVEVALLSSIPKVVSYNGGGSNLMTPSMANSMSETVVSRQRPPPLRYSLEREDISVDSVYTSTSSTTWELGGQQRVWRMSTPTPTTLAPTPLGATSRVRTASPAFQSLVEKFEQSRIRRGLT